MKTLVGSFGLYLGWLVAMVATAGSLYFSEVRNFVPCPLCWYQRIFMYPLVLLLGVASYRNDKGVLAYALPLSLMGAGTALYHYLVQKVPGFGASPICRAGVPCNVAYINWLGFITIPFLALVAFTLISALLIGIWSTMRKSETRAVASENLAEAL